MIWLLFSLMVFLGGKMNKKCVISLNSSSLAVLLVYLSCRGLCFSFFFSLFETFVQVKTKRKETRRRLLFQNSNICLLWFMPGKQKPFEIARCLLCNLLLVGSITIILPLTSNISITLEDWRKCSSVKPGSPLGKHIAPYLTSLTGAWPSVNRRCGRLLMLALSSHSR